MTPGVGLTPSEAGVPVPEGYQHMTPDQLVQQALILQQQATGMLQQARQPQMMQAGGVRQPQMQAGVVGAPSVGAYGARTMQQQSGLRPASASTKQVIGPTRLGMGPGMGKAPRPLPGQSLLGGCWYFGRGLCQKGNQCPFSHEL